MRLCKEHDHPVGSPEQPPCSVVRFWPGMKEVNHPSRLQVSISKGARPWQLPMSENFSVSAKSSNLSKICKNNYKSSATPLLLRDLHKYNIYASISIYLKLKIGWYTSLKHIFHKDENISVILYVLTFFVDPNWTTPRLPTEITAIVCKSCLFVNKCRTYMYTIKKKLG